MNMLASARYGSSIRATGPLTEDALRRFAPSIFAEAPHESRSSRYGYIPTINVVRGLEREGFSPVFACEAKARDVGKLGFTKHMVRFRRPDTVARAVGDTHPELVMVNSHDGSSSYHLFAGLFRLICLNGMVCGEGYETMRVPHKGDVVRDVIEGAYSVVGTFKRALDSAEAMKAITLTRDERGVYAEAALALKYHDEEEGRTVAPIVADTLLVPQRYDDRSEDLWTTFNVAQEHLVRGGDRGRTLDANGRRRRVTTRAVKGIDGNVKLNRALWTLTEKMAELKGAKLSVAA